MTVADFLAIFPEFTSFDAARIAFWLSVTANQINASRWGALANQGQALLTAHYLMIDQKNNNATTQGRVDGPISSKSAGGVSITKDTASVVIEKGGQFNATNYGQLYIQLSRKMGAGGMQVIAQGFSFPDSIIF
jgi:hypothetical protein